MSILNLSRANSECPSGAKMVRFQLDFNLESLFQNFVVEKDAKCYEELVCKIRDVGQEIRDDDLVQLLKEARGCITKIDGNFRLFVKVVLILRWTQRSQEVVDEYKGFLQDLCAAHNYYTKQVIEHILTYFKSDTEEWENGVPSEKSKECFKHLHQVLVSIVAVIPMSQDIVLSCVRSGYPYIKKPPHEHESFVYNVLQIALNIPTLRYELLNILFMKLVSLDVNTPAALQMATEKMEVDGVFEMEETSKSSSIDYGLTVMFNHIQENSSNLDYLKLFYWDTVKIFDSVILPTHSTQHVQFVLFYIFGLKPGFSIYFVKFLWEKVRNPTNHSVIRQTAVCYIASLLARAKYVSVATLQEKLSEMSEWIHSYIVNQDESGNYSYSDTKVHGVFYATCQAVFYIIAFRYKDLIQNKGLSFLQGLNLTKIITSRLNPLKVCLPVVVSNFASVARAYQLAYCYTIIERNSKNTLPQVFRDSTGATVSTLSVQLDTFFPFDPYLLPKSKHFITPYYRESFVPYESGGEQSQNEDDDDFLEMNSPKESSALANFAYSTSPGFLH